jgi:hypothetical protein
VTKLGLYLTRLYGVCYASVRCDTIDRIHYGHEEDYDHPSERHKCLAVKGLGFRQDFALANARLLE